MFTFLGNQISAFIQRKLQYFLKGDNADPTTLDDPLKIKTYQLFKSLKSLSSQKKKLHCLYMLTLEQKPET